MKTFLIATCFIFSFSAFSQESTTALANPSDTAADADKPKGTIVSPTLKQLKSVKKPKKGTEVQKTETSTPTTTPSN